jgi:hypothetical protein
MNDLDEQLVPVFVSYSHKDQRWLDRLLVHLTPLEQSFQIVLWSDTKIRPGSQWREEIRNALKRTKIAILLVSADFLASDFIRKHELPPLLTSAELEGATILSLLVSPCRFVRAQEISKFQAVNSPDATLISISPAEQELAFVKLAHAIEDLVIRERAARAQSTTASPHKVLVPTPTPQDSVSRPDLSPCAELNVPSPSPTLAWSVVDSPDYEPSSVTSVENFLDEATWVGLLKIGNWIRDGQDKRIVGADPKTYLLSQQDYGGEPFIIDTTLIFTNFKAPRHGKLGMNAGILLGWQYDREEPRYLNLLLTGESMLIERCGFGGGRDTRDFDKLTTPVPLAILAGEPVRLIVTINDSTVSVSANGRDVLSAPRPLGVVGRVGIRPWRSKVDITSFVVESM